MVGIFTAVLLQKLGLLSQGPYEVTSGYTYRVDHLPVAPYPRACHDSFVIGFDGSETLSGRIVPRLCLRTSALAKSLMATVRGASSDAPGS